MRTFEVPQSAITLPAMFHLLKENRKGHRNGLTGFTFFSLHPCKANLPFWGGALTDYSTAATRTWHYGTAETKSRGINQGPISSCFLFLLFIIYILRFCYILTSVPLAGSYYMVLLYCTPPLPCQTHMHTVFLGVLFLNLIGILEKQDHLKSIMGCVMSVWEQGSE